MDINEINPIIPVNYPKAVAKPASHEDFLNVLNNLLTDGKVASDAAQANKSKKDIIKDSDKTKSTKKVSKEIADSYKYGYSPTDVNEEIEINKDTPLIGKEDEEKEYQKEYHPQLGYNLALRPDHKKFEEDQKNT